MFRTLSNKLLMLLYFVVGTLVLEALTFLILDLGIMPQYFWYNFFLILVVGVTIFIIPNYTAQYVVYTFLIVLQGVLIYVNYSLSRVYGDLLSFEMVRLIREAGMAMTASFVYFAIILEIVLVEALLLTLGALLLQHCRKDKNTVKQHFSVFALIIFISSQLLAVGFSVQTRIRVESHISFRDDAYVTSDSFLMNTSFLKSRNYEMFGTYGYYTNMMLRSLERQKQYIKDATLDYFNAGTIYGEEGNDSPVFGIDEGNNVIVIMMESVEWFGFGDGTYDATLNNLKYVDNTLEAKTFTPNITKLIYGEDYLSDLTNTNTENDALIAKNFFAKSKTNMSEGQGIIGNYPIGQPLTSIVSKDAENNRAMGYAMPNVLRNMGYNTTYVHSHDISFYSRGKTHYKLGFDNVVGKDSITDDEGNKIYKGDDLDFDNWDAEGNFAKNALKYIVPDDLSKPFYTFYLNVSSHGAYTAKDNKHDGDAIKYYNYIKYGDDDCELDANGNYQIKSGASLTPTLWYQNVLDNHADIAEDMVFYQCGIKGLDDAIGVILNKLKNTSYDDGTKLIDKTTLLLYSDHYAYYDKFTHSVKGLDKDDNNNQELNTIPMIISSPNLKKHIATEQTNITNINTRFTSAFDVVPTLFDLLGVKFNERLYLGHSLFGAVDYVYEDDGQTKDMVVYYSNTGGLFGDGIYTFDMVNFTHKEGYKDATVELFKAEASKQLVKLNYLLCLNEYRLYPQLSKK